ncbi:MAG: DUF2630 family protein [Acetobacteraceae bacterium]
MSGQVGDGRVLAHIRDLVSEEERLYAAGAASEQDLAKLRKINVELDQCWDLLRQRRALREFGENPDEAAVRPAATVEKYEG